jgi:hypothetical protein
MRSWGVNPLGDHTARYGPLYVGLHVSESFNFELSPKELASNIRYPSNTLDYSSTSPTTQHSKQTITDAINTSTIHRCDLGKGALRAPIPLNKGPPWRTWVRRRRITLKFLFTLSYINHSSSNITRIGWYSLQSCLSTLSDLISSKFHTCHGEKRFAVPLLVHDTGETTV